MYAMHKFKPNTMFWPTNKIFIAGMEEIKDNPSTTDGPPRKERNGP